MRLPFISGSYTTRSINFDAQQCINWYPTKSESGTSKNVDGLQGTPGKLLFCDLVTGPIRGSWQTMGRGFAVSGRKFYEIFSDGTFIERGTVAALDTFVDMDDNGQQVVLVDGTNGYIFTLATNLLQQIVSDGWRGSNTVSFVGGSFVFVEPGTQVFYWTALYDGMNIDALDFASAEGSPDNLVANTALAGKLWLFGTQTTQVYYVSEDANAPYQPIDGAFIQYGCAAAHSVANSANTTFWLGDGVEGNGVVWMATGYQPQRISTFALEFAISQYGDISNAKGHTYEEEGHYFYCLNFPTVNKTWVYDIGIGLWHERGFWDIAVGEYRRDLAQNHIFIFGKHLVGSWQDGKIYEQSLDLLDDNGAVIRRLRAAPHSFDSGNLNYIYYHRFQLDMQTGVGNGGDPNPQMSLAWSNDAGHTWSNEHTRAAGQIGEYNARAIWRQLGRARDRVFRVITTAKARMMLIGAHVEATKGGN